MCEKTIWTEGFWWRLLLVSQFYPGPRREYLLIRCPNYIFEHEQKLPCSVFSRQVLNLSISLSHLSKDRLLKVVKAFASEPVVEILQI